MRSTRPDLIVPIRDRRQHRRILTLKNFRNACVVMIALVAGLVIEEHLRNRSGNASDYGRLFSAEIQSMNAVEKTPQVVAAAPIDDHDAADPMLVRAAAREQLLMADSNVTPPPVETVVPTVQRQEPLAGYDTNGRLVITGGPEGVSLVKQASNKPVLGGGFGR